MTCNRWSATVLLTAALCTCAAEISASTGKVADAVKGVVDTVSNAANADASINVNGRRHMLGESAIFLLLRLMCTCCEPGRSFRASMLICSFPSAAFILQMHTNVFRGNIGCVYGRWQASKVTEAASQIDSCAAVWYADLANCLCS